MTDKIDLNIVNLEFTNKCNLNCTMCNFHANEDREGRLNQDSRFMDAELLKRIINELAPYNDKSTPMIVLPPFRGESTLYPQFEEMIDLIKSHGMNIAINTNGIFNSDKIINALLKTDMAIFSVDARTREMYTKIRGNDLYDTVTGNIGKLMKARKKGESKPNIQVSFVLQPRNKRELKPFIEYWLERVDSVAIYRERNEKGKCLSPSKKGKKIEAPGCYYALSSIGIYSNGDVVPCCNDCYGSMIFGNLKKQSLESVYNSERYRNFRKAHSEGKTNLFEICRECDMSKMSDMEVKNKKNYTVLEGSISEVYISKQLEKIGIRD